jgi:hypothetical protein
VNWSSVFWPWNLRSFEFSWFFFSAAILEFSSPVTGGREAWLGKRGRERRCYTMAVVYLCAFVVVSEERIFVFSDWELIAVSFRLETCCCSVSQNIEFLRAKSCSFTFAFRRHVGVCLEHAPKNARAWEWPRYATLVGSLSYKMAPFLKECEPVVSQLRLSC